MRKLLCLMGWHEYVFVRPLSVQSDLVQCCKCNNLYAINYSVQGILKYDRDLEKFYEELNGFFSHCGKEKKIDRERLKEALSNSIFVQKGCEPIMEAAQLLLDITAPDYVPTPEMRVAGQYLQSPTRTFRAMAGELCK